MLQTAISLYSVSIQALCHMHRFRLSIMMSYTCAPYPMQLGFLNIYMSCVATIVSSSLEVCHDHGLLVQLVIYNCQLTESCHIV